MLVGVWNKKGGEKKKRNKKRGRVKTRGRMRETQAARKKCQVIFFMDYSA